MCLPKNPSPTTFGFYIIGKKNMTEDYNFAYNNVSKELFPQEKCTQGFTWIQTLEKYVDFSLNRKPVV